METHLLAQFKETPEGREAEQILRSCVHCGFCTATCPTYQLLGDELDGPRGRIYLIKQLLENGRASAATRLHLDRCLLCRACETTCPSGMKYSRLLGIGRKLAHELAPLPLPGRLLQKGLTGILPRPALFKPLLKSGQLLRPLLPEPLRRKLPPAVTPPELPQRQHTRKVLLFQGCVQPVAAAQINAAAARLLERLEIQSVPTVGEQCCGAVHHHLNQEEQARRLARANIDRWLPLLESVAETLLFTASACALEVTEYPRLFDDDPEYREKALQLASQCHEIGTWLARNATGRLTLREPAPILSLHLPCTLQHGLKAAGELKSLLDELGIQWREPADAHLCCGSAGTYSITQPVLSDRLRNNKLAALEKSGGEVIASANIGCLLHLQAGTDKPVKHWVEWLEEYTTVI